jgi:hypothetical protein
MFAYDVKLVHGFGTYLRVTRGHGTICKPIKPGDLMLTEIKCSSSYVLLQGADMA